MTETTETITENTAVDAATSVEGTADIATESLQQEHIDDGLDEFRHENGKIFGKFTTAKDGMLAYKELQKEYTKSRQENKPAPDKYMFELDEDIRDKFELDENHPDYQRFVPMLKQLNISQEKANRLMNEYARMKIAEEEGVDFETEMEKVGGVNGAMVQGLVAFAKKNLDQDGVDFLSSKIRTAEDAQFFDTLIKKARGANVSIPSVTIESTQDIQKTSNDWLDEAFTYKKEHERTIGYTPEQQEHYMMLMQKAVANK